MKKADVFFNIFGGEFVEIIHTMEVPSSINIGDDGQTHEMKVPLTLNGFIMDIAEGWVFLSPDGENIDQAIPLEDVRHISIINIEEQSEEADIPEPENKNYN